MKHIMVDLETLGTTPGAVILSIGAVEFGPTGVAEKGFYTVLNTDDCMEHYLHQDDDTKEWWEKQTHEARQVLRDAADPKASVPLKLGLAQFNTYVGGIGGKRSVSIWGNGANFDNPLLAVAYKMAAIKPAYEFYNERCYRTLKNLVPGPKLERVGTYHNALDDARSQALHAVALLTSIAASGLVW